MLPLEEARQRILAAVAPLPVITLPFTEAAGHVLAADIIADESLPPWPNSGMDGFAVRAEDLAGASTGSPVSLRLVADIPAGHAAVVRIGPGEAARIMTGARIPDGADAVVMVENTRPGGEDRVEVLVETHPGKDIRPEGEVLARGERALAAGDLLRGPEIGLLASLGRMRVPVHRRPVVGLFSTGDELVPPDREPGPGLIRDANRFALAAQVRNLGCEVVDFGHAPDREEALEELFGQAAARCDVVVSTGGVSVGDHDLTLRAVAHLGRVDFWRVAIKPGKPVAFGFINGKPVFGLPGNPASSLVVMDQIVRPALRRMAGHARVLRETWQAVLEEDLRHSADRTEFIRAIIRWEGGRFTARSTGPQGSNSLRSLTQANGLIIVPAGAGNVPAGSTVDCQLFIEDS
jgi:molybdopterin molybdotransferase